LKLKTDLQVTVPIVIHGFSKNQQVAKQLLDAGFYLSFGKYLLRNPELEAVFKFVPNEKFLLETDTCEETIESVYALAARYKELTLEEMQQVGSKKF
jgi:TatD DNase family protein